MEPLPAVHASPPAVDRPQYTCSVRTATTVCYDEHGRAIVAYGDDEEDDRTNHDLFDDVPKL